MKRRNFFRDDFCYKGIEQENKQTYTEDSKKRRELQKDRILPLAVSNYAIRKGENTMSTQKFNGKNQKSTENPKILFKATGKQFFRP